VKKKEGGKGGEKIVQDRRRLSTLLLSRRPEEDSAKKKKKGGEKRGGQEHAINPKSRSSNPSLYLEKFLGKKTRKEEKGEGEGRGRTRTAPRCPSRRHHKIPGGGPPEPRKSPLAKGGKKKREKERGAGTFRVSVLQLLSFYFIENWNTRVKGVRTGGGKGGRGGKEYQQTDRISA